MGDGFDTLRKCAAALDSGNLDLANDLIREATEFPAEIDSNEENRRRRVITNFFAQALARRAYGLHPKCPFSTRRASKILHEMEYKDDVDWTIIEHIEDAIKEKNKIHIIDMYSCDINRIAFGILDEHMERGETPLFLKLSLIVRPDDYSDIEANKKYLEFLVEYSNGIAFEFEMIQVESLVDIGKSRLKIESDEFVVVEASFVLGEMLSEPVTLYKYLVMLRDFIKPDFLITAERDAHHTQFGKFIQRFNESLQYYSTLYSFVPDYHNEGQQLIRYEISNVMACEGSNRVVRHMTFYQWQHLLNKFGFSSDSLGENVLMKKGGREVSIWLWKLTQGSKQPIDYQTITDYLSMIFPHADDFPSYQKLPELHCYLIRMASLTEIYDILQDISRNYSTVLLMKTWTSCTTPHLLRNTWSSQRNPCLCIADEFRCDVYDYMQPELGQHLNGENHVTKALESNRPCYKAKGTFYYGFAVKLSSLHANSGDYVVEFLIKFEIDTPFEEKERLMNNIVCDLKNKQTSFVTCRTEGPVVVLHEIAAIPSLDNEINGIDLNDDVPLPQLPHEDQDFGDKLVCPFTIEESKRLEVWRNPELTGKIVVRVGGEDVLYEFLSPLVSPLDDAVIECSPEKFYVHSTVMTAYFNLLKERNSRCPKTCSRFHSFSCHMGTKILEGKAKDVSKWYKPEDLAGVSKLFLPLCLSNTNHWILFYVNIEDKKLFWLDPLKATRKSHEYERNMISKWFTEHLLPNMGHKDALGWTLQVPDDIPSQKNKINCGILVMKYADCLTHEYYFPFEQKNMPHFRERIFLDIVYGKILSPHQQQVNNRPWCSEAPSTSKKIRGTDDTAKSALDQGKMNIDGAKYSLAKWIIKSNIPLNQIQDKDFQNFLRTLQPRFKLQSEKDLISDILRICTIEKNKLCGNLEALSCRFNLEIEMWEDDDKKVLYCCLITQFITDSWEMKKKILSFKVLEHGRDAVSLREVIELESNLIEKVLSLTIHNRSSIDVRIDQEEDSWASSIFLFNYDNCLVNIDYKDERASLASISEGYKTTNSQGVYPLMDSEIKNEQGKFSLVLAVATILNPQLNWRHVKSKYEEVYDQSVLKKHLSKIHGFLSEHCYFASSAYELDLSEISRYTAATVNGVISSEHDILNWWRKNIDSFPTLGKIAREFLAIPLSTMKSNSGLIAEVKKVVSTYKDPEVIMTVICCQDWLDSSSDEEDVQVVA